MRHICVIPLLALTRPGAQSGEQAALPCLCCVQPCHQLGSPFIALSSYGSSGPSPSTSRLVLPVCSSVGAPCLIPRSLFNQSANESLPLPAPSVMPILCTIPGALQGCRFWLLSGAASSPVPPSVLLVPFVTSPCGGL